MPQPIHLPAFRRRAWLLTLGLLAMALHLLAGSGLIRAASAAGSGNEFVAELCTSHGLVQGGALQTPDGSSAPASGVHDCCKSCAAGGPLLTAGLAAAVAPAPTFTPWQGTAALVHPMPAARTAHAPRGPPAQA